MSYPSTTDIVVVHVDITLQYYDIRPSLIVLSLHGISMSYISTRHVTITKRNGMEGITSTRLCCTTRISASSMMVGNVFSIGRTATGPPAIPLCTRRVRTRRSTFRVVRRWCRAFSCPLASSQRLHPSATRASAGLLPSRPRRTWQHARCLCHIRTVRFAGLLCAWSAPHCSPCSEPRTSQRMAAIPRCASRQLSRCIPRYAWGT